MPSNHRRWPILGLAVAGLGAVAAGFATAASRERRRERTRVGTDLMSLDTCLRLHDAKVARVAGQLRGRTSTEPVAFHKRTVSHQVPKAGDLKYRDEKIDLTDLDAILHIDPERRLCIAEPGVAFEDLVVATMRHGLVPVVVPELRTITIGGAVSGCSLESMSFRYGGFHDGCVEYEVITARGDVLRCTPDNEHSLVFQMIHGAFGTLGVLSKLVFRLVPAKPFVHVRYERFASLGEFKDAIWRHSTAQDADFIDGFVHSPTEYVLNVGTWSDVAPYTHRYDWTRVYYRSTRTRNEDYLAAIDYFFRYDRGVTNVHPKSWLGRVLVGRFLGSTQVLRLAEKFRALLPSERPTITLDVFVPFSRVDEFLAWYRREFDFFPLWCVPYRRVRDYEWLSPRFWSRVDDSLFLDLAIYGMKQRGGFNMHQAMEDELMRIGGIKTLISHNYYSEQDFWQTWNKETYDAVKSRTDPDNIFRDLYTKTCRAARGME